MKRKIRVGKYYLDLYRMMAIVGALAVIIILIASSASKKAKEKREAEIAESFMATQVYEVEFPDVEMLSDLANYKPVSKMKWSQVDERGISSIDGLNYWDDIPGMDYGQCTGYVSWVATKYFGIKNYPHSLSYGEERNGGEYVSSQRLWLVENATLVGSATTEDGEITYHGNRYQPGDIIVFSNQADGHEGKLYAMYAYDEWGEEDQWGNINAYYVHIGIVGSSTTMYQEEINEETGEINPEIEEVGILPEGQYNMHHNIESHLGVVNMLSPEQFITRNVPADDYDYSRSYEIYRVLTVD